MHAATACSRVRNFSGPWKVVPAAPTARLDLLYVIIYGSVLHLNPAAALRIPRGELLRKNSVRAYVFRFTLELGHCGMQAACPKGANNGSRGGCFVAVRVLPL